MGIQQFQRRRDAPAAQIELERHVHGLRLDV